MQTISLWNPWAVLLAHGLKCVETRGWPLRGPFPRVLAVHAARKWDRELRLRAHEDVFRRALMQIPGLLVGDTLALSRRLPFGAVVGVVRIAECLATPAHSFPFRPTGWYDHLSTQELAFGDYSDGRHGWVCDRFFALPQPVPAVGRQRLFNWEPPIGLELPAWARGEN